MEVIHDGWLKKSPPEKRIWRAKWRRRWFVLRQSGQIPGQYVLEYYTDTTCKKLKGRIDLDQCEQVDAGVSLETVTRKCTYEHVFDIRTPKRIYYLVADRDNDMNTWVNFISTVCGLKMQVEEEYMPTSASSVDQSHQVVSGQPLPDDGVALSSGDPPFLATGIPSGPYIPISECTSGPCPVSALGRRSPPPPAVAPRPPATTTTTLPAAPPLHPSNDNNRRYRRHAQDEADEDDEGFPDQVPPPPPKIGGGRIHSAEFYDYPRQINPPGLEDERWDAPDPRYNFRTMPPPAQHTYNKGRTAVVQDVTSRVPPPPPKVNWETYPRGGGVDGEGGAIYENQQQMAQSEDCYDHPQYHHPQETAATSTNVFRPSFVVPQTDNASSGVKLERLSMSDSGVEMQRSASSSPQDGAQVVNTVVGPTLNRDLTYPKSDATEASVATLKPPPRPPKPSHLSEAYSPRLEGGTAGAMSSANYDNIENCEVFADSLYDVPPSAQGVFLSKSLPAQTFAYLRDDSVESVIDAVPPVHPGSVLTYLQEETYDMPRPLDADRRYQLDATPPAPKGESLWQRRHAYVNALDMVVVEESEAHGQDGHDEYLSMDAQQQQQHPRRGANDVYTDMSGEGRSPSAIYSNVPSPMTSLMQQHRHDNVFVLDGEEASSGSVQPPPCVDRGLKPRRRTATGTSPVAHGMSGPYTQAVVVGGGGGGGSPISQRQWKSERKLSDTSVQSLPAHLPGPQPPPTINRCLKPKRAVEAPDVFSGAPAIIPTIASLSLPTKNKRSFRKARAIPNMTVQTASPSRLTSTNGLLHPPNHRLNDKSSSDDDHSSSCSSRRNSSNDDHLAVKQGPQHTKSSSSPSAFGFGRHHHHHHNPHHHQHHHHHHHESEVQYLDLDLESDASAQSPKSPERFTTATNSTNSNTVYKTVDFVKTKAFNEMRQNVEETYRKSQ